MQLLNVNAALDCTAIAELDLINPSIMAETGRDLLTLQEEQRGLWSDYLYQRFLNQVGGEIIVSVIPEQYIKPLYKNIWVTTASQYTNYCSKYAHGL